MQTITFTCETITPMFLAGADGTTPELRAPSIKGALRFWWRAMNGDKDLKTLQEEETKIFGGTSGDSGQRSNVLIRVSNGDLKESKTLPVSIIMTRSKGRDIRVNIFEYLAYGTYDWNKDLKQNILKRPFIETNQVFQIHLSFRDEKYKDEIIDALKLASYFGGIGSKSRNGFGSFKVKEFMQTDYITLVRKFKSNAKSSFTNFSDEVILFDTKELVSSEQAHAEIGKAYKYSRENIEDKHYYNLRPYVASPLIADKVTYSFLDRHSKCYFMNVLKLSNGKFKGVMLFLPYNYLEKAEDFMKKTLKIKLEDKRISQDDKDYFTKMLKDTNISIHQEDYNYSANEFNTLLSEKLRNIEL